MSEAASAELTLADHLARAIATTGPISIARFMAVANKAYYDSRDPLGAAADFVTAPEISQMFGELIGVWVADLWDRAGRPDIAWIELGPGRGTLTADALRAMAKAGLTPPLHFVETSNALRAAQRERVPNAAWHDDLTALPDDRALIVVANEFFDALPIRQIVRGARGWHERMVAAQETLFLPVAGNVISNDVIPAHLRDAAPGSVIETSPASVAIVRDLAQRIRAQGGAALIVDYGYEGPAIGDTFQAVKHHAYANPFDAPGERDLTAHIDFATLGIAAVAEGCASHGPVDQGAFLKALGIDTRAAALGPAVAADRDRLVGDMGTLFKALAIRAPDWPEPAGFA